MSQGPEREALELREVEVTWACALSIWWLIFWRAWAGIIVGSVLLALLLFAVRLAMGLDTDPRKNFWEDSISGLIFGLAWGSVVVDMALRKRYRDFRIALLARARRVLRITSQRAQPREAPPMTGAERESLDLREVEVTWGRVLSVWWLIYWRTCVGSFVLGLLVGFVLGFLVGFLQSVIQRGLWLSVNPVEVRGVYQYVGFAIGIAWSVVVVHMALTKRYRDFRIALMAREQPKSRNVW